MTTVIINEKTKKGKIILALMKEMGIGTIIPSETDKSNDSASVTINAMKDALAGKTTKCCDFSDYLKKTK